MSSKYFEKLKDPRWQKKRLEILERDRWTCTVCQRSDLTLHVHHAYYDSKLQPWEYDNETLHTVCVECHDAANVVRLDIQLLIAKLPIEAQQKLVPVLGEMNEFFADRSSEERELVVQNFEKFLNWFFTSYWSEVFP